MAYRVDLHVHTQRYSPCAELLDPAVLPVRMQQAALAGVVLTEHDVMWPEAAVVDLRTQLDPGQRIYRGVEVTAREAHFVVIGLKHLGGIEPRLSAFELVERAHEQGAVVILAHPLRRIDASGPPRVAELPTSIDAIEHPWTVMPTWLDELVASRGWRWVSGSDAHAPELIGESFTEFAFLPADESELASAILSGQAIPRRTKESKQPCSSI